MADIIIGIILIAAVAAVIIKMRRDKKSGKSGCGCNCGSCGQNCGKAGGRSRLQSDSLTKTPKAKKD